jgi:hypothetical protein
MKTLLLAFAVLFVMGTLALAQSYDQSQSATSTPSSSSTTASDAAALGVQGNPDPQASPSEAATDSGYSYNYNPQNWQGTELQKAYQEEPRDGWRDPNVTKSGSIEGAGGSN